MSISITTIQPQDSIAASRLTLNSNFSSLKTGIDAVQTLLNPADYTLSGVKSITVTNSALPLSSSVLQVGKGASIYGDVIMGTTGASTSVVINGNNGVSITQSTLTLGLGNLVMSSTSTAILNGNLSVGKEVRLPGANTAFSTVVGLTQTTPISVTDKKYLVITNGSTASTVGLTATLLTGSAGQVLEIFHIKGPSGPVQIDATNFYGLTGSVTLTQTGDTLKVVFDGTNWYMWNYSASSFATAGGATVSSISFTTNI